ncbi:MAG TPA: hypothetical protein VEB22_08670 [Phycisphaerales bacterium]|nr:hypothetical protein [Phycisphaerales bacterium]
MVSGRFKPLRKPAAALVVTGVVFGAALVSERIVPEGWRVTEGAVVSAGALHRVAGEERPVFVQAWARVVPRGRHVQTGAQVSISWTRSLPAATDMDWTVHPSATEAEASVRRRALASIGRTHPELVAAAAEVLAHPPVLPPPSEGSGFLGPVSPVSVAVVEHLDRRWVERALRLRRPGLFVLGMVMAAEGLWLAAMASAILHAYQREKTGRCPTCGYVMAGLPTARCPECGDAGPLG